MGSGIFTYSNPRVIHWGRGSVAQLKAELQRLEILRVARGAVGDVQGQVGQAAGAIRLGELLGRSPRLQQQAQKSEPILGIVSIRVVEPEALELSLVGRVAHLAISPRRAQRR